MHLEHFKKDNYDFYSIHILSSAPQAGLLREVVLPPPANGSCFYLKVGPFQKGSSQTENHKQWMRFEYLTKLRFRLNSIKKTSCYQKSAIPYCQRLLNEHFATNSWSWKLMMYYCEWLSYDSFIIIGCITDYTPIGQWQLFGSYNCRFLRFDVRHLFDKSKNLVFKVFSDKSQ